MIVSLVVLLMLASASSQCDRDTSTILGQVKANGLQSLNSLHDYVWILDSHETFRRKGKIEKHDLRRQTVVANGQMYTRDLHPGELPTIPESEAALSSGYHVSPALYGDCGGSPCGTYPYAFLVMITLPDLWDVLQVREGNLNGVQVLVIDLQPRRLPSGAGMIAETAWVARDRCRLLRLVQTRAKPDGHDKAEEVFEYGEIKGNWLPIRRELRGATAESTEEYTYLKFGAFVRMRP